MGTDSMTTGKRTMNTRVFKPTQSNWAQSITGAIRASRIDDNGRCWDFIYLTDSNKIELAERAIARMRAKCLVLSWYGEEWCNEVGVEYRAPVPGEWVELEPTQ